MAMRSRIRNRTLQPGFVRGQIPQQNSVWELLDTRGIYMSVCQTKCLNPSLFMAMSLMLLFY
jgi:hypothetical protein